MLRAYSSGCYYYDVNTGKWSSNGMDIYFRVAFKPVATLIQKQEVLTNTNTLIEQQGKGRHDPCVVPRAVPIVEAMAAIVLADFYLLNKTYQK
jgi:chorismate synthase